MALPFTKPLTQTMPSYACASFYGCVSQAVAAASATLVIAATSTMPAATAGNGFQPFNTSGEPAPCRGKLHLRASGLGGSDTTVAVNFTATDGTSTVVVGQIPPTVAGTVMDYTLPFITDLGITSLSAVVTLGGTQTATVDWEVSLN